MYYFYINSCILNVASGTNASIPSMKDSIRARDTATEVSIATSGGDGEFRLGFMLQFITIYASSRVGLLNRRLKSVRMYRSMILWRGHVRQFCGRNSVNKIHRYVLHCRELFPNDGESSLSLFISPARIFETISEHVNILRYAMEGETIAIKCDHQNLQIRTLLNFKLLILIINFNY